MRMEAGSDIFDFFYDHNGDPYSVKYNGTLYYYITNLQGDVVCIVKADGKSVGVYKYDAWGNILYQTDAALINKNPLRYRGYIYDTDTGFYYLQSRYYDPKIGRFLNADTYAFTGTAFLRQNMFTYCLNCPVNMIDVDGEDAVWLQHSNGAWGFGHTSLLIQDSSGRWNYYYWGTQSTANKIALITGTESVHYLEDVGYSEIDSFDDVVDMAERSGCPYATQGLDSYCYIEGDFSKSIDYLSNLKDKQYSLVARNCVQTSVRALYRGEFEQNNIISKTKMIKTSLQPIPNNAYHSWKRFSTVSNAISKAAKWVKRLFSSK